MVPMCHRYVYLYVCLSVYKYLCDVQVHRGVTSRLSVKADATSSWFRCVASNKLDTDAAQTEFYISGVRVFVCICVCVCVVKCLQLYIH